MFVHMKIYMYVCMNISVYVCMYAFIYVYIFKFYDRICVGMNLRKYVLM